CLLVVACSVAVVVQGVCNSCQTNDVMCLNETHYEFCAANVQKGQIDRCPDGQVCTSLRIVCMDKDAIDPACPNDEADGSCASCDGSSLFVCTSRNTFQMCDGTSLTGQTTYCKDDTVCSIRSGKFCVDSCEITDSLECDRDAPE
ncbi:hypothetical protein KR018_008812, partial [Drosophila ironensis]